MQELVSRLALKRFAHVREATLVRTDQSINLLQDWCSIYWINTYDTIRAGGLKRQINIIENIVSPTFEGK